MNHETFDEASGRRLPVSFASVAPDDLGGHGAGSVAPPSARGWWCKFSGEFKFLRELHPDIDRAADECELSPTFVFASEADAQWFYDKRDRYMPKDVKPEDVARMVEHSFRCVYWDHVRGVFVFKQRFVAGGE